ncbi:MAG: exosortase-associated EpsI family protein [Verrucomicrobiota bacterium]
MAAILLLVWTTRAVFAFFVPEVEPTLKSLLTDLVPKNVQGWKTTELPLSITPAGEERVLDILKLDDHICRTYSRGDTEIMLYAAYWLPGSEPYSSVGLHNPDSCWVIAGWDIQDRESARKIDFAGCSLKSHEWGIYRKDGSDTHVMFWHLLGGEPNEYIKHMIWTESGIDSFKRQFYFIFNIYQLGLDLGRDQLFVRISSNKAFDLLEKDPHFQRLFESFAGLGIETSNSLPHPSQ